MIEKNHDYYIIWDNEQVPIIKCKGNDIIENWDDVLAVAFDTCFVDCRTEKGFLSCPDQFVITSISTLSAFSFNFSSAMHSPANFYNLEGRQHFLLSSL